jgi:hypothetical protein
MSSAVWPASLPQNLRVGDHEETPPDTVLRTEMDAGPAKARKRFSTMPRKFSGSLVMTRDQLAEFDEFFNDVIGGGALPFEWKIPRTAVTCDVRLTKAPAYKPTSPRAEDASDYWIVTLDLEVMPGTETTSPGGPGPGAGSFFPTHLFNDSEGGLPTGLWGESLADELAWTRDALTTGPTGPVAPIDGTVTGSTPGINLGGGEGAFVATVDPSSTHSYPGDLNTLGS